VTPYTLRPIAPADRPTVTRLLTEAWGAVHVYVVALGGMVDAGALPGWLAEDAGDVAGLLTYRLDGDLCDLVTINSYRPGAGTALIERLTAEARDLGATSVRVTTTNDNTDALRFYQRRGFRLSALRPGAVDEARLVKPEIPALGEHGIPIRDELDLLLTL
jgi:ribosomal protein S18 acetylase RimI-like enzyme